MHGTHGTRGEAATHGVQLVASVIGEHAATCTGRRCNDQAPSAEAAAYCHANPNWGAALLSGAKMRARPLPIARRHASRSPCRRWVSVPRPPQRATGASALARRRARLVKFAGRGERTIKPSGCIKLLTGGHR